MRQYKLKDVRSVAIQAATLPDSKRRTFLKSKSDTGTFRRGSARLAVSMGRYVLKVAFNEKGRQQNRVEYDVYRYSTSLTRKYLARIYDYDQNYEWLIAERLDQTRKRQKYLSLPDEVRSELRDMLHYVQESLVQYGISRSGRKKIYDYGFNKTVACQYY